MNRPKVVATGLLIAVFVAGIAVGGAASAMADRTDDDGKEKRPRYTERLQENLDLTANQRTGVEEALVRYNAAIHQFWKDTRVQKDSIGRITRAEIMGLLDEAQQALYADMNAGIDSVRAERRRKHDEENDAKR